LAVLAPIVFLLAAEGLLRLAGAGYPSSFFLRKGDHWVSNQRFGWRFFPPRIARDPLPILVPVEKPAEIFRIFVLGGSAAMGIPDPAFSFARMLEVMLEKSYPNRAFEVHNVAMTAINSHVVRVIARDCARLEPDLLIAYLGNNEVVGPYGAGTVFPGRAGRLGLIRSSIRVRGTRIGQLMESVLRPPRIGPTGSWEGMEMFIGHRVTADDPRLGATYNDFRANLLDMADAAADAGVPLLVSTVGVNLADSPPFDPVHAAGLPEAERQRFATLVADGDELVAAGDHTAAAAAYRIAVDIDGAHAGTHYRLARALVETGEFENALGHFAEARDLDALRFRADGRINHVIREAAAAHPAIVGVDGEAALAGSLETAHGIPGDGLFWEHVHLRFEGNYALAAAHIEALGGVLGTRRAPIPSMEDCAGRLAFTAWDRHHAAAAMLAMMSKPPFDNQLGHIERLDTLRDKVAELHTLSLAWIDESVIRHREAVELDPDDLQHRARLAEVLQDRGAHQQAAERWRELLEVFPENVSWLTSLGFAELEGGNQAPAIATLKKAVELRPRFPGTHINVGSALRQAGDADGADAAFRRAIAIDPGFEPARISLGSLLASLGRLGDAAAEYTEALRIDPSSSEARFGLGSVLERQGKLGEAAAEYRLALAADPGHAMAGNNLGLVLEKLGQPAEAEQVYRRTIEAAPRHAMTHFNLADLLLGTGRPAEALDTYRTALGLQPDNMQARLNSAICLQLLDRPADAAVVYRGILEQVPNSVETRLRLALLLATATDAGVRDPAEAARLAAEASRLTNNNVPEVLEAQAQVYAAIGSTGPARDTFARALEIARATGQTEIAARIEAQLRALE
jgi:tetratricopeptide (TPR) repeat protein